MGIFDSLSRFGDKIGPYIAQVGETIAPYAQQRQARSDQNLVNQVYALNPEFASRYYGDMEARKSGELNRQVAQANIQKLEQDRLKQSKLQALAEQLRQNQSVPIPGSQNMQLPVAQDPKRFLTEYAAITGDPSGLIDYIQQEQKTKTGADTNYGLTPLYGTDAQGGTVPLQLSNKGGVKPVTLPEGITLSNKPIVQDLGDRVVYVDPITRQVVKTEMKALAPADQPANAAAKETAVKNAAAVVERETKIEDKAIKAGDVLGLAAEARKILPEATSGLTGKLSTETSKALGISTPASKADSRLKVIGAALVSNVPRMEGPQSNYDVELYKQAAGDVANYDLPREDRLASLDTIEQLQSKYTGGFSEGTIQKSKSGKYRIRKGGKWQPYNP